MMKKFGLCLTDLLGHTFSSITTSGDDVTFESLDGHVYQLGHQFQCCEDVHLADTTGDLNDLIGSTLLMSEEVESKESEDDDLEWTFYKFATVKGYVTFRFCANTDTYYSTAVDLIQIR
jgi:hypothetical protein